MIDILIDKITIRNFRSISKLEVKVGKIGIFVGQNDAGKSNILRAVNLFFNNETDPGSPLDFAQDFHIGGSRPRKADEISIELELSLPDNYRETNGDLLVWRKTWRKEDKTPSVDNYYGRRIIIGKRGAQKIEEFEIPSKSNLHATLKQISFQYIPANKNTDYFDALRGQIYHTIAGATKGSFHRSSQDFEKDIGKHLLDLTEGLSASLGFESKLSLPTDLSGIFEKLDFISPEKIPLKNRGEGIKGRHIPHILFFMAQKQKELSVRGGPRFTTIWGYEEPENNLEMSSCSVLAKEIFEYCRNGIAQSLITTHSPIFYNVGKDYEALSSIHYVYKDEDQKKTLCAVEGNLDSIDLRMGVTGIYAEKIKNLQNDIQRIRTEAEENKKLFENLKNQEDCACIFVEGLSDKIFLERVIDVFMPEANQRILVETKESGAGHNYVLDMLAHWRARHKHHTDDSKALGIVDEDASKGRTQWNQVPGNTSSAKCFVWPRPPQFIGIDRTSFNISLSLEVLYPEDIWKSAYNQDWLEERMPTEIFKKEVLNEMISAGQPMNGRIPENAPLFLTHNVKSDRKIQIARMVARKADAYFKESMPYMDDFLEDLMEYLDI